VAVGVGDGHGLHLGVVGDVGGRAGGVGGGGWFVEDGVGGCGGGQLVAFAVVGGGEAGAIRVGECGGPALEASWFSFRLFNAQRLSA